MNRLKKALEKKAKKGFKGYPIASVAFYGPTHKLATKVAVGVTPYENAEPFMMRWHSEIDIRNNTEIMSEVLKTIRDHEVISVVITDRIIGCPHEEVVDYPAGESCQKCPYWLNRDRWSGEKISLDNE